MGKHEPERKWTMSQAALACALVGALIYFLGYLVIVKVFW